MELFEPNVYSPACPSRVTLDRIGDRWTALIVGILEDGPRRFTEIRDAVGISPKVLTQTLRALERDDRHGDQLCHMASSDAGWNARSPRPTMLRPAHGSIGAAADLQ